MSNENNSTTDSPAGRPRRGSFTTATFGNLFGRSNSTSGPHPGTVSQTTGPQRRMSINTLGLSGTSPMQTSPFALASGRRGSVSTAGSDSIDENAVDDEEGASGARSIPSTPFSRRMSFGAQALFASRTAGSPGTSGRSPSQSSTPPDPNSGQNKQSLQIQASSQSKPRTASDFSSLRSAEGLNWSEQFRSRAESTVSRPPLSANNTTPTKFPTAHDRSKSISEMPAPPSTVAQPASQSPSSLGRKPDAIGERMLRGEFYMD